MKAVLELTESRVKVHIERLKVLVNAMQADLDKLTEGFADTEKEYFVWKQKIQIKKDAIDVEKEELNQLVHFDKFKHQPKPALIQQQIVKQKKKFRDADSDIVPLPQIKWVRIIQPALEKLNRFVKRPELWKYIVDNKLAPNDLVTKRRFDVACSSTKNKWFIHNETGFRSDGFIGLREWNLQSHLNDFYHAAV